MATYTFGEATSSTSSSIKNNWYRSYSVSSINSSVRNNIPKYSVITEAKFYFEGYQTIALGSSKADGIIRIGSSHTDDTYGIAGKTGNLTKGNWTPVYANNLNCVYTSGANTGEIKSQYSSLSLHYLARADIARTLGVRNTYIYYTYTPPTYTISLKTNNDNWGTVSGGGTWDVTTSSTPKMIIATAKTGYRFVRWKEDGNTNSSRAITISQNNISSQHTTLTLTAEFEPDKIEVLVETKIQNLSSFNQEDRKFIQEYCKDITISGGGTYDYGTTITLKCENLPKNISVGSWYMLFGPSYDSILHSWEGNPLSVRLHEDSLLYGFIEGAQGKIKIVANIYPATCHINPVISPNNNIGKIVTVDEYDGSELVFNEDAAFIFGRTYTFRLKIDNSYKNKYKFTNWGDGTTDLDITIRILDSFVLTAYFEIIKYKIDINVTVPEGGTVKYYLEDDTEVTGQTEFEYGTWIRFSFIPNEGYVLTSSSVNIITITRDTIVDFYVRKLKYKINLSTYPSEGGMIVGQTEYEYGDIVRLEAIPNVGYKFTKWGKDEIENSEDPILIFRIEGITEDTNERIIANFKKKTYHFTKSYEPLLGGNVKINGSFASYDAEYGEKVTFEAVPNEGYKFIRWSEESLPNPFWVEANDNAILYYKAYFEELKPKFKSVKIYYPSGVDVASPTNPLIGGQPAQIVVKIAME